MPTCRCGHPHTAHDHYRPGRDCGLCGCPRYAAALLSWSPRTWLRLRRENARLRAEAAQFAGIERALRLQLRIARAERDARTGPAPHIPTQRQGGDRGRSRRRGR